MNGLVEQIAAFDDEALQNLEVKEAAAALYEILLARRLTWEPMILDETETRPTDLISLIGDFQGIGDMSSWLGLDEDSSTDENPDVS